MIDCNITKNYFSEKARMTNNCHNCENCLMSIKENNTDYTCGTFEAMCTDSAIEIVQNGVTNTQENYFR